MKFKNLLEFAEKESKRLKKYYGYDDRKKRILARTVKLGEEVGELSNKVLAYTSLQQDKKLKDYDQEKIKEEFADVLLVTLLFAKGIGTDVENSLEKKIQKIKERYAARNGFY